MLNLCVKSEGTTGGHPFLFTIVADGLNGAIVERLVCEFRFVCGFGLVDDERLSIIAQRKSVGRGR
jgi:hypothetical protein